MINPRFLGIPAFGSFQTFDELNRMRRQMDRLMDAFGKRPEFGPAAGVFPAINVTEDDDQYYLRAELPGLTAADLEITATGKNLSISGERKLTTEDASAKYHRREREGGRFSRALTMPKEIDAERIEAKITHGILTLRLPKSESVKPRRITIGS